MANNNISYKINNTSSNKSDKISSMTYSKIQLNGMIGNNRINHRDGEVSLQQTLMIAMSNKARDTQAKRYLLPTIFKESLTEEIKWPEVSCL